MESSSLYKFASMSFKLISAINWLTLFALLGFDLCSYQVVRISTVDKKSLSYVDLYEYLLLSIVASPFGRWLSLPVFCFILKCLNLWSLVSIVDQFVNIPLTTNQQTSSGWVMSGWALTSWVLQLRLQLLRLVMKTSVQEKYLMLMMILLTQTHLPGHSTIMKYHPLKSMNLLKLHSHIASEIDHSVEGRRNNHSGTWSSCF